jgi:hypothetical protein
MREVLQRIELPVIRMGIIAHIDSIRLIVRLAVVAGRA